MNEIEEKILGISIGGTIVPDYVIAIGVFLVTLLALYIVKTIILQRLLSIFKNTEHHVNEIIIDSLSTFGTTFYFAVSLYVAVQFVSLPDIVDNIINGAALVVVTGYIVFALQRLMENVLPIIVSRGKDGDLALDRTILNFIKNAMRAVLWVAAVLIVLQNLGFQITALLGGLGIAGVAIAFAFQNILSDIFAFFSIYFDKPFQKGDFIVLDDKDLGTVEQIGIKTTRVRSLQGHELVLPNQELTSSRINNYKTLERRRVEFTIGIIYETPQEKIKKIPEMIKDIIEKQENAKFSRAHFTEFGDFSLNFEIVYFVTTKEFEVYRDTQQAINLSMMKKFEKEKIEFAYPTQKLFVTKSK